jgi:ATP-dependent helicase Lhr and Lhr-like helicase
MASLSLAAPPQCSELRATYGDNVKPDRLIVRLPSDSTGRWWTWAGTAANRSLQASLPRIVDPRQRIDEKYVRLVSGVTVREFSEAMAAVEWRDPDVDVNALRGLKFSSALPEDLAKRTLGARLGDLAHAVQVSTQSLSVVT